MHDFCAARFLCVPDLSVRRELEVTHDHLVAHAGELQGAGESIEARGHGGRDRNLIRGGVQEFGHQGAQLGIILQLPIEHLRLLGAQSPEHTGTGQLLGALIGHSMSPSSSRSLSIPRRILALTVPSGCSRREAISV